METVEYLYLIILGIFCLSFTCIVYRNVYKKGVKANNRYKLYKIRDDLIFLVAKGAIKEDDFIFKTFYEWTNTYIQHIHRFRLREINKAMQLAKEKGYIEDIKEFIERIEGELKTKDKEVEDVIREFFETMLQILLRNSFVLRLLSRSLKFTVLAQRLVKRMRILRAIFVVQEDGYRNYRMHSDIYNSLAKVGY